MRVHNLPHPNVMHQKVLHLILSKLYFKLRIHLGLVTEIHHLAHHIALHLLV
jgi:hypothetical protein